MTDLVVQLREILPRHTPGARRTETVVFGALEPLGMMHLQLGCPTRVVDGNIQKQLSPSRMHRIHQLDKLLKRRGLPIKFRQGRIHIHKIDHRERAAVASHASIGRGRGVNRKKLNNSTTQRAGDKIEFLDQVAERPGLRNDVISVLLQYADGVPLLLCQRLVAIRMELPHKGGVQGVSPGIGFGLHLDP